MGHLTVISGAEAVRQFQLAGWTVLRQKGSHVMMSRPGHRATLSIPQHRELDRGTLRAILRSAGIRVDEFLAL